MDLKELGELLKNEREKQGYSLDDVYSSTKISPIFLRSIESGDTEELPHLVYAKGFVKNYAFFLGLDGEELSDVYEQNLTVQDGLDNEVENESFAEEDFVEESSTKLWTFFSILATIILLGVLSWLAYDVFLKPVQAPSPKTEDQGHSVPAANETSSLKKEKQISSEKLTISSQETKKSENSGNASVPLEEQIPSQIVEEKISEETNQTSSIEEPQAEEETQVAQASEQTSESEATEGEEEIEKRPVLAENEIEVEEETSKKEVESSKEHSLKIFASEACWLRAEWEDTSKQVFLRPGESVKFKFSGKIEVKLGNAGGVSLEFDNEPYVLEAKSGEVKTLVFP